MSKILIVDDEPSIPLVRPRRAGTGRPRDRRGPGRSDRPGGRGLRRPRPDGSRHHDARHVRARRVAHTSPGAVGVGSTHHSAHRDLDDDTTWAGWTAGASVFLPKPFDPNHLLDWVERLLATPGEEVTGEAPPKAVHPDDVIQQFGGLGGGDRS